MELTQIEPFDILILEPITSLTDLITGLAGIIAAFILHRQHRTGKIHQYMKLYLLFLGIAVGLGAFFAHAFLYVWGSDLKMIGWSFGALATFFLQQASITALEPFLEKKWINLFKILVSIQLIAFYVFMLKTRQFQVVQTNASIGMVGVVLPLQLFAFIKTRDKGHGLILLAIAWGIMPAITFNTQLTLHAWFNYHDISHVLMTIFIVIMFYGSSYLYRGEKPLGFFELWNF